MLRPQIVGLAVWALAFSPIPASSQPTPTRAPHTVVKPNPNPAALQPVELTDPAHPPGAGRPGEAGALTVESSVKLGLKTNPSIKVADERVATAVAQYEQSSSQKNPQLVFSDTTSMRPNPVVISTSPLVAGQGVPFPSDFTIISQVQSQINMSLQVLLTSFGRVEHQIAASYLNIDAQAKSTDLDRRNLTLQIKQAFLQHLKTLAAQEAANANLVVTEQNLKDTNALFHQGILAKFDSVQAELQVVQATQDLQQRKTQIKTTAATLRALLLLPQQDPLLLVPPPPIVVDPEVDVPRLQALALTHRPELISLSRQMDVAKALLDAAHCEGNPQVGMNLTYLTNPGNNLGANNLVVAGLNFSWALYDGGLGAAKVREAESKIRSIDQQAEQIRLQVCLDAENSWLNYQQTYYDLTTAEKKVQTAAIYYDMARQRYIYGLGTSLETQDALRSLNDARVNLVVAYYDRDLAFTQLENSLGMDFFDRHLSAPPTDSSSPEPTPARQGEPQ